jgi:hypothetical protein
MKANWYIKEVDCHVGNNLIGDLKLFILGRLFNAVTGEEHIFQSDLDLTKEPLANAEALRMQNWGGLSVNPGCRMFGLESRVYVLEGEDSYLDLQYTMVFHVNSETGQITSEYEWDLEGSCDEYWKLDSSQIEPAKKSEMLSQVFDYQSKKGFLTSLWGDMDKFFSNGRQLLLGKA